MAQKPSEGTSQAATAATGEGRLESLQGAEGFYVGKAPLKVVTGQQTTTNLNFELKPGSIVAHPRSTVVFVCG